MGYMTECVIMDAKQAYYPGSSGRLSNQYIIQDHMVSHYKKLFSAKASVDSTVPKSMRCSIKYNDQKRREQLKKDMSERAQSARFLSHKGTRVSTRASCSSKNSRPSVQGDESAYLYLGSSMISSPRLNTSFHSKQIVYPSRMAGVSGSSPNHYYSASEFSYRSPKSQRQHSARSCTTTGSQSGYKAFQDPTQKTYSGDLMLKHAHHFTQEKPFTPRTLKSDSRSSLSQYRYYTPPRRKQADEKTSPRLTQHQTNHGSTQPKGGSSAEWDLPQASLREPHTGVQQYPMALSLEYEWSDEESNAYGRHSKAKKTRDSNFLPSSSRVSPEGMKSPTMRKVNAEEEELMYLEFIADVTNEILSRGLFSDRVLQRVFERHIDMNKHRLDEVKMRHLLEVLYNDLQSPSTASCLDLKRREMESHLLLGHMRPLRQEVTSSETKEDSKLFPCTVLDKDSDGLDNTIPILVSPPLHCSLSESAGSHGEDGETEDLEEQIHKDENGSSLTENNHLNNDEDNQNSGDNHRLSKELKELERNMAVSLCVSETLNSQEVNEQERTAVELSDDDF